MIEIEKHSKYQPGFFLALFATICAVVVIGLGAYTRLVHAGLGCPDWPGCYGFWTVPDTMSMLDLARIRYPDAPVDGSKGWPEMVHRYAAGFLIVLVVSINILQWWRRYQKQCNVFKLAFFTLCCILLQAAFGMWTVTLKLWPQVVTMHLLGGITTLILLFIMTLKLINSEQNIIKHLPVPCSVRIMALFSLGVVCVQIVIGGWLSANYAAMACPDFPFCQGSWWPTMDWKHGLNFLQSIGPNYLGGQLDHPGRTAIHVLHRIGALCVTVSIMFFLVSSRTYFHRKKIHFPFCLLLVFLLLVLQLFLGISNVIFYLPLSIAVLHNLVAVVLCLALVWVNFRFVK